MSLIKDMLENLEHRNEPDVETEQKYPPVRESSRLALMCRQPYFYVIGIGVLILVAAAILVTTFPKQVTNVKNYALSFKNQHSATAIAAKNTTVTTNNRGYSSSEAVHKLYMQAVNDLNEGKTELAMSKLKSIIDEDPNFIPAKRTYAQLLARYGVNQ